MTTDAPSGLEAESLVEFLARPEITPEIYQQIRALHNSGRRGDEPAQRIWNITRRFTPKVHVGSIRDQIEAMREFPADSWAETKAALVHLEAGLLEFGEHGAKRLILRPRRERLEAAMRAAPKPPTLLLTRIQAALRTANA